MTKHTPGPWRMTDFGPAGFTIFDDALTRHICTGPTQNANDEDRTNARLIAAAPQLLDALERVQEAIANNRNIHEALEPTIGRAIAKARGEDN